MAIPDEAEDPDPVDMLQRITPLHPYEAMPHYRWTYCPPIFIPSLREELKGVPSSRREYNARKHSDHPVESFPARSAHEHFVRPLCHVKDLAVN